MLAHNSVLRDSRVLKEAKTLDAAGYQVEIHGISGTGRRERHLIPGTQIVVHLSPNLPSVRWARIILSKARRFLVKQIKRSRRLSGFAQTKNYESISSALVKSVKRNEPPDIIHIHDHVPLLGARVLKGDFGVPVVWDAHEIYEQLASLDSSLGEYHARIIAENQDLVDGFVTISESFGDFYKEHYAKLPEPTIVMNATMAEPPPLYDGRLHEAAGLPRDQKILLFQGGLGLKRGLRQLVEAAPLLKPNWSVVLMGWGNLEPELRELAKANTRQGSAPAIVFLPGVPQDELLKWSAGATLGVIPYEDAGLNHLYCTPNKLWEYPAALVPILATDLVEMGAIIRKAGIGFLLPRDFDKHDIANAVNGLKDDAWEKARENCKEFIRTNSWEAYAPRLRELYESLSAHA